MTTQLICKGFQHQRSRVILEALMAPEPNFDALCEDLPVAKRQGLTRLGDMTNAATVALRVRQTKILELIM